MSINAIRRKLSIRKGIICNLRVCLCAKNSDMQENACLPMRGSSQKIVWKLQKKIDNREKAGNLLFISASLYYLQILPWEFITFIIEMHHLKAIKEEMILKICLKALVGNNIKMKLNSNHRNPDLGIVLTRGPWSAWLYLFQNLWFPSNHSQCVVQLYRYIMVVHLSSINAISMTTWLVKQKYRTRSCNACNLHSRETLKAKHYFKNLHLS